MSNTSRGYGPLTEAEWSSLVLELAHRFGWRVAHFRPARTVHGWRTPVAADGMGYPDLTLVHEDGPILWRELKTDRGRLTPEQESWIALLAAAGGDAAVWRPRDGDAVAATLTRGRVTTWSPARR